MSVLNNKVDFVAFISVNHANPNGDPINGNRPRDTMEGLERFLMSALSVKSETDFRIWVNVYLYNQMSAATMVVRALKNEQIAMRN